MGWLGQELYLCEVLWDDVLVTEVQVLIPVRGEDYGCGVTFEKPDFNGMNRDRGGSI